LAVLLPAFKDIRMELVNNKSKIAAALIILLSGYSTVSIATPGEPGHCHWDGDTYHCTTSGGSSDDGDETSFDPLGNSDRDTSGEIDPDDEIYGPKEATPEEKEAAKQECTSKAQVVGTECAASYAMLNSMCKGTSLVFGGAVIKVFNKSLNTVGWSEVGGGVVVAHALDAACAYVDVKAKAWCKVNTEKLVKNCD
jgi:hypothetical protein